MFNIYVYSFPPQGKHALRPTAVQLYDKCPAAVLPWKALGRGSREGPPSPLKGQHGVRVTTDEKAVAWLLLEPSTRGQDATLPSTIATSTYGLARHRQAARSRGGLLSKSGDSYTTTTKRESIGPSTIPVALAHAKFPPIAPPSRRRCRHASIGSTLDLTSQQVSHLIARLRDSHPGFGPNRVSHDGSR